MNADALAFLADKGFTVAEIVEFARLSERKPAPPPVSAINPQAIGPKNRWGYDGPETPRLPERDWWPLRNSILDRDKHTCRYCGDMAARMCADHVVPLSRGGTNDDDNLVACCIPCNSSKADRLLAEWPGRA